MLNTKKLLYILPDLAYIAELLPAKKEYSFTIQSFRQINGEFITEDEFIATSIEKLFSKLEKEEYHLILPDFLFTNTIVTVEGTSESKVLEHVSKVLLPQLNLTKDSHDIDTTVLTSFKGNSKVQISAIEKSVLAPIRAVAKQSEVAITAISPLTWSVKAIISLEPSISILQMGSQLYTALHYIGVDQTNNFPMDDYEAIVETVKTLKGSEPSVQSIYLASSTLIEEDIKEKLSGTLPIQQVVSFKEDETKMPSYIRHIIESTMKTLAIPDFPVPQFKVGKATEDDLLSLEQKSNSLSSKESDSDTDNIEETSLPLPSKEKTYGNDISISNTLIENAQTDLPTPNATLPTVSALHANEKDEMIEETKKKNSTNLEEEDSVEVESLELEKDDAEKIEPTETLPAIPNIDTTSSTEELQSSSNTNNLEEVNREKNIDKHDDEIDLSQFASKDTVDTDELAVEVSNEELKPIKIPSKILDKPQKKIIKNSSGVNNMLKMVFITVAVFFITIAVGIGVGLGLLKLSEGKTEETTPAIVSQTPTPEPTTTPTPEPIEINKEELSILVVNATTKAGYAGTIKALLADAEIEDVTAANAKGEYDSSKNESDILIMSEKNVALQELLEKATDLSFTLQSDTKIEDPTGKYDAIIVLTKN